MVELETPKQLETATPYRARLDRGAELYLPPWFTLGEGGGYDLIVHFHGEGRWQEENVVHAHLDAAVVSVNLGIGTAPYSKAFRDPRAFERLLADAEGEIARARHAHAHLRRLALSAWSAGSSSVARAMTDSMIERVDAVLLADGLFTHFTNPKKRTVNARGLEKFARFAEAAMRGDKLFAITHTTIPTGPYPSVQECVAKLLEMLDLPKAPSSAIGPRGMQEIYAVERGGFRVHGFEGTRAADHVRQLHAMGETMYPYLKARWERSDEATASAAEPPRAPVHASTRP